MSAYSNNVEIDCTSSIITCHVSNCEGMTSMVIAFYLALKKKLVHRHGFRFGALVRTFSYNTETIFAPQYSKPLAIDDIKVDRLIFQINF